MYECIYCGKTTFKTQRGLDQHLQRSLYCKEQNLEADGDITGYYTAEEGMAYTSIVNQAKISRPRQQNLSNSTDLAGKKATNDLQIHKLLAQKSAANRSERGNLTVYPNEEYATDYEEYGTAIVNRKCP